MMSQLDRGVARIASVINNAGLYFIPNIVTAIFSIVIVFRFDWKIGLAAVLSFAPYAIINYWRSSKNQQLEREEHELFDTQYAHFWESISSIATIKAFTAETYEKRRMSEFHQKIFDIRKQMERFRNISSIGDIILESWMWGIYVYLVWLAFSGSITVGTFILMVSYLQMIREPLWNLNWIYWEAKVAQVGATEYFEILDSPVAITDADSATDIESVSGKIEFRNVTFSYPKRKKLLQKLSFSVNPGETVALVGPSGSGKTTIVSLILRFFDPDSGQILIDNTPISNFKIRSLRKQIGLVMQDTALFADTIIENMRYGKAKANLKQIKAAATAAHAHEFIQALPQKYKTQIGEKGIKLSGGQRQRLSIARTILKDPPIIILDEATSALDSESEMLIQRSLKQLLKGRTALIIAHRLSTIASADKILVIEKGKIIEQGSHQELLSQDGLYASLFKIQSGQVERLHEWGLVG